LVRERLKSGDTDAQVLSYLTQRYGDYVLLRPPVRSDTLLLWFGPAIALLIAGGTIVVFMRRRRALPEAAPLGAEEERRLARLLDGERGPP
jgi:cytochrome c-type biogenesis protein CcmH